ncbi:uncharacterized protein LOC132555622 [Ylistrum balloti]|uniref:uncharacterized protein LOC132555622 n=1 Tax=Ylistrum balloti TaxID=509963 RepID=UPI002905C675|nr:uncharacterized protein LOC132555622 [Ylistrum balloti]
MSTDSGIPLQSNSREGREDTDVKAPILAKPQISSESDIIYNGVKSNIHTTPYVSETNPLPSNFDPYVHLKPKHDIPENNGNGDIRDILKQLVGENKEKNPGSGNVINIGNINIYNSPDQQYYGTAFRRPPDPCVPHHYDYPEHPKGGYTSPTVSEEDVYIGRSDRKTAVEHNQSSVPDDEHIKPYRVTRNFLSNSRPFSGIRDTSTPTQLEQRAARHAKLQGPEETPTRIIIQPRHSSEDRPRVYDVQLIMKDSKQRWEGELKSSSTQDLNQEPLSPADTSNSEDSTYNSHSEPRDGIRPTISEDIWISPQSGRQQDTEINRTAQTMSNDYNEDIEEKWNSADDNTIVKVPSSATEDYQGYTKERVNSVVNPVYMRTPSFGFAKYNNPPGYTNYPPEYSNEMQASHGNQNLNRGWSMSQSTPDIRQNALVRTSSWFPSKPKVSSHQCSIAGFVTMHDEKTIEDAKEMLESNGKDGNWLVTSAVRQPMQSHCLHVRLHSKISSFPINKAKNNKLNIDTTRSKSFACICKLIYYYTNKKNLPNQDVKLADAFRMPPPCGTTDTFSQVSHL